MTKLEAVIQPAKFEAVKDALIEIGVEGMTVTEVRGHGTAERAHRVLSRPRIHGRSAAQGERSKLCCPTHMVDQAVQAITNAARTGKIGDGKIFLSRIDEAIRIRNDERGETAL